MNYIEYQDIKNADIERDKYALPLIMPMIEKIASNENGIYSEKLKQEIEEFKQRIDYKDICEEVRPFNKKK